MKTFSFWLRKVDSVYIHGVGPLRDNFPNNRGGSLVRSMLQRDLQRLFDCARRCHDLRGGNYKRSGLSERRTYRIPSAGETNATHMIVRPTQHLSIHETVAENNFQVVKSFADR